MFNTSLIKNRDLQLILNSYNLNNIPAREIQKALETVRSAPWSVNGNTVTVFSSTEADPRILELFSCINKVEEKEETACSAGFESLKELVESHLTHALWNRVEVKLTRSDEYAPLGCFLIATESRSVATPDIPLKSDREASSSGKRGREEFEEENSSSESEERERKRGKNEWGYLQKRTDEWFKERKESLSPQTREKIRRQEELYERKKGISSSSSEEGRAAKRACLLTLDEENEFSELSREKELDISRLERNWTLFKKRIEKYPPAELFDSTNEENRKEQYERFASRFTVAFAHLNAKNNGEIPFSLIPDFINSCYQGWDVEIKNLEHLAQNKPFFSDPVLKAWQINRDVRRSFITKALSMAFKEGKEKFANNPHYQSGMTRAMNHPFWLGYSSEELPQLEPTITSLCREIGLVHFKKCLDEDAPSEIIEILKEEFVKMAEEERKALFEEALDKYREEIHQNTFLLLDEMNEAQELMSALKEATNLEQVNKIYHRLITLEVQPPFLNPQSRSHSSFDEILSEATVFSNTFLEVRAQRNRFLLEQRLVEDQTFGAYAWAALAKVIELEPLSDECYPNTTILQWLRTLPLLEKQKESILEAAKSREATLCPGEWREKISLAIDKRDIDALIKLSVDSPIIYESLADVTVRGSETEILDWLKANPMQRIPEAELAYAAKIAFTRKHLRVLWKLAEDPRNGSFACVLAVHLLAFRGKKEKIVEIKEKAGGEIIFRRAIDLATRGRKIGRALRLLLEVDDVEIDPDDLTLPLSQEKTQRIARLICTLEKKGHSNVSSRIIKEINEPMIIIEAFTQAIKEEGDTRVLLGRLLKLEELHINQKGTSLVYLLEKNYNEFTNEYTLFSEHKSSVLSGALIAFINKSDLEKINSVIDICKKNQLCLSIKDLKEVLQAAGSKPNYLEFLQVLKQLPNQNIEEHVTIETVCSRILHPRSILPIDSDSIHYFELALFVKRALEDDTPEIFKRIQPNNISISIDDWVVIIRSVLEKNCSSLLLKNLFALVKSKDFETSEKALVLYKVLKEAPHLIEGRSIDIPILSRAISLALSFDDIAFFDKMSTSSSLQEKAVDSCLITSACAERKIAILEKVSLFSNRKLASYAKGALLCIRSEAIEECSLDLADKEGREEILHNALAIAMTNYKEEQVKNLLEIRSKTPSIASSKLLASLLAIIRDRGFISIKLLGMIYFHEEKMGGDMNLDLSGMTINFQSILESAVERAVEVDDSAALERLLSRGTLTPKFLSRMIATARGKKKLSILQFLGNRAPNSNNRIEAKGSHLYCQILNGDLDKALELITPSKSVKITKTVESKLHKIALEGLMLALKYGNAETLSWLLDNHSFKEEEIISAYALIKRKIQIDRFTVDSGIEPAIAARENGCEILNAALRSFIAESNIPATLSIILGSPKGSFPLPLLLEAIAILIAEPKNPLKLTDRINLMEENGILDLSITNSVINLLIEKQQTGSDGFSRLLYFITNKLLPKEPGKTQEVAALFRKASRLYTNSFKRIGNIDFILEVIKQEINEIDAASPSIICRSLIDVFIVT